MPETQIENCTWANSKKLLKRDTSCKSAAVCVFNPVSFWQTRIPNFAFGSSVRMETMTWQPKTRAVLQKLQQCCNTLSTALPAGNVCKTMPRSYLNKFVHNPQDFPVHIHVILVCKDSFYACFRNKLFGKTKEQTKVREMTAISYSPWKFHTKACKICRVWRM